MNREEWRREVKIGLIVNRMTKKELAEKVGVSTQYINMLERGQRSSAKRVAQISKILGIGCFDE